MVREKIVWQYIAKVKAGDTATIDPMPMADFDFLRVYCSVHGSGSGTLVVRGSTALPSGYAEKDGLVQEAEYLLGNNTTQILDLTGIVSLVCLSDTADFSIILQGIKYEPC